MSGNKEGYYLRDVVFPIIKATENKEGYRCENVLGTGVLTRHGFGLTASQVLRKDNYQDIYCMFCVNNRWEAREITNIQHYESLGVAAFSVVSSPYSSWLSVSNEEHRASCEFQLWAYPKEYFSELDGEFIRPDLAYHQGYIIRRISDPVMAGMNQTNQLFEINLTLSETCYGAPLVFKNYNECNRNIIGIYLGSRKIIVNEGYEKTIKLLDKDDGFWEKLQQAKENPKFIDLLEFIVGHLSKEPWTQIVLGALKKTQNKKSELELINQHIKTKQDLKETLENIMKLIAEDVTLNYGLAARTSGLFQLNPELKQ